MIYSFSWHTQRTQAGGTWSHKLPLASADSHGKYPSEERPLLLVIYCLKPALPLPHKEIEYIMGGLGSLKVRQANFELGPSHVDPSPSESFLIRFFSHLFHIQGN